MLRKCWRKLELDQVGTAKSWQTESRIGSWGAVLDPCEIATAAYWFWIGQNEASDSATEVATWPQKVEIEARNMVTWLWINTY